MPRHVLFMYSLQDPKGMSVGLHVCKVPRWNGTDKLKKSWRSPSVCLSVCLSTVCPCTGKNWWWGWFLFLREDRENCKVLYGSSTEPQDRNHRRIWCEKVGVVVETLGKRCLNTLLVPGLHFRSFKEQMDMCVLTDEPSLWQFSWPPWPTPASVHSTSFASLIPSPGLSLHQMKLSAVFSYQCMLFLSLFLSSF